MLRTQAVERHTVDKGLRRAIERRQFEVHYQPIGDLHAAAAADQTVLCGAPVVGAEALVRWRHPERGLVPPGAFIERAEETGLIVPIGRMVLAESCAWLAENDVTVAPTFLSVNVSARQLIDQSLAGDVRDVLDATGIDPGRLHLEITESALMVDPDTTDATFRTLKSLGVRIAIDDFGTGYSSFAYLRRFAVDLLKIDKSFIDTVVDDERELALVAGMVQLAHTLDARVVAEGVETIAQLDALRDIGCDMAQGYALARPQPAAALVW
jgi:EAL domain-containing protein (putative c-di-GMP-specific phosphodiesterase class I)